MPSSSILSSFSSSSVARPPLPISHLLPHAPLLSPLPNSPFFLIPFLLFHVFCSFFPENGLSSPHPNTSTSSNSSCSASGPGGGGGVIGGGMLPRSTAVVGKKSGVGGGTGGSRGGGSGRTHHKTSGDHPKTTRVRTVLNEKQLHTLRTCYAANPRPDALMKDQLVEMTGLSSRVIRVWFQNKRCKDKKRTILIKQIQQQHHDKVNNNNRRLLL